MRNIKLLLYPLIFLFCFITSPQQINAENILLSEDFNDGDALNGSPTTWQEINGDDGSWQVKFEASNGYYLGTVFKHEVLDYPAYAFTGNQDWTDYIYEVSVKGLKGVDRYILFRCASGRADYGCYKFKYHDENANNGLAELSKSGTNYALQTNTFHSEIGDTHKLKVVLKGPRISIYIDGNANPIIDYTDINNPYLYGRIGLMIWPGYYAGYGGETSIAFDDIVITKIDSGFNLPINYDERRSPDSTTFNTAFWARETAVFDHARKGGLHIPFTGESYKSNQCPKNTYGEKCYDSHNGTDFSKAGGEEVYSVADGGTVLYTSKTDDKTKDCTPDKGGYGCVIIVKYADNLLGLYAHLSQILVTKDQEVNEFTQIGVMGNTGCKPKCGVHLHFSVLKSNQTKPANPMTDSDWRSLLYDMMPEVETSNLPSPTPAAVKSAFCSYKAPNEQIYYFVDPSGWKGSGPDPWSLAKEEHGCAIPTENLWKFDLVKNSTSQTILPIFPNLFPI